ncbi:mediator of RNA polymerase II transcription subunit 1-like isoform X2 [Tripterygium wilfordii]|uniref:mediator of RNA polymerase II transcription subunit 1-like isoform X2 n=1 Tax=Tripterygium wilfordii TaxID=458696 RepID=UPI0018F80B0A|nr:mediator of RNA polymerase II transcription subunit 1-like isoform X2 [Tripterygium wilfordii]
MERSEPALVPEWLRSTGSVTGGGSSVPHFSSSSSHADVPSLAHHTRSRNPKNTSDFDSPRPGFLDRTSSSNSRRGSSYGSAKHAYSSFGRNHRDKDRERDKERSNFIELWDRDGSESLGNFSSRGDNALRRSQSMVSRKQNDILPRRVAGDSKKSSGGHYNNGNGMLSGVSIGNSIPKTVFEKDFPTLGTEEKQGIPDIGRVSSPGLSTAVQSLPVGNATLIGGEGWTSALAEVPAIVGSSTIGTTVAAQTVAVGSVSGTSSPVAGMNMAGALQTPSRTRAAPQTQRLEELAIKQSRQLIPVTPSMPKGSVLSSSDKSKPKSLGRASEMIMPAKNGPQPISSVHHVNQSLHGGHVKSDVPKTSQGKLFVLKPGWENGLSPSTKDTGLATNANGRVANTQAAATPLVASASLRSPNNSKLPTGDWKSNSIKLISGLSVEKRPLPQSRHDFLKGLKMKTPGNTSAVLPDSPTVDTSPTAEKPGEISKNVGSAPATPHATNNGAEVTSIDDTCSEVQRFSEVGEKNMSPRAVVDSVEEEFAFLRSLGWEENSGEDEGLTEEEINAFYQQVNEYMKSKPSFKLCRGVQPKIPESHTASVGGASSELRSSDSGSED